MGVREEGTHAEVVGADPDCEDGIGVGDGGLEEWLGGVDAVGGFVGNEGGDFVFEDGGEVEAGGEGPISSTEITESKKVLTWVLYCWSKQRLKQHSRIVSWKGPIHRSLFGRCSVRQIEARCSRH